MQTISGTMITDRPARYAKQLADHWAERGTAEEVGEATVLRWPSGQVIELRPADGALEVTVTVPDGEDLARFAQVVKDHLERFGRRDELDLAWASDVDNNGPAA